MLISTYGPPAQSYVTHYWMVDSETTAVVSQGVVDLANFRTITLLESRTTTESGTTGLRTWLASKTLAQYLISHPGKIVVLILRELHTHVIGCRFGSGAESSGTWVRYWFFGDSRCQLTSTALCKEQWCARPWETLADGC